MDVSVDPAARRVGLLWALVVLAVAGGRQLRPGHAGHGRGAPAHDPAHPGAAGPAGPGGGRVAGRARSRGDDLARAPLRRGLAALGLAGAWLGLELAVPYEFLAAAREPAAPDELGRCGTGIWMSTWSFRGSLLLCPCAAVATMVFAAAWTKYANRLLREPVRPLAVEAGALGAVTSVPLAAVFLAGPEAPAARGATAVDARTATTCTLALLVVVAAAAARAWLVRPSGAASGASPSSR